MPHDTSIVVPMLRSSILGMAMAGLIIALSGCNDAAQSERIPAPPAPVAGQTAGYKLGSGDRVHITVFGQPDMSGEYRVDGAGQLAFPLIGQVKAGGLTADQLTRTLEARLSPDYLKNPHVSVEVMSYRPFYIVGEVKTPGSYAYVSGMTVLNAVALAGGFTYRAREDSFYVSRSEKNGAKEQLTASADTPVEPGDVITVRERYF